MLLKLTDIGMIKEAEVKLDGLTVIAGENDTGKSTVGKALFFLTEMNRLGDGLVNINIKDFPEEFYEDFDEYRYTILRFNFSFIGTEQVFLNREDSDFKFSKNFFKRAIFIETPYILDLENLFSQLDILQNEYYKNIDELSIQDEIILDYPYTLRDLYKKLRLPIKRKYNLNPMLEDLEEIIKGKISYNRGFKFIKNDLYDIDIDMRKTAVGIKSFGIIQILIENNYLNKDSILILDEPEVHLHPKWQLEYAKIIVNLVKNGIRILVTSHSPYMIEALQRYSEKENIHRNFYLAEDGYIKEEEGTLSKIFEKLSEPFNIFDEIDSEKLQNG